MLEIDGSIGEGGGQVLRSALALSLVTGTPFRIFRVRARRKRPGLARQHLAAVHAAAAVGSAELTGAELGSTEVTFRPHGIVAGEHYFDVGSAGSTTLVLETVLPALVCADAPSRITLVGGTDNPLAPPFDFLAQAYLPLLDRMGPRVTAKLERRGFYPAGGGRFSVEIQPCKALAPLELLARGALVSRRATAIVARLPPTIADRELAVLAKMGWDRASLAREVIAEAPGPGNIVSIVVESENVTEVMSGVGERGVPAEVIARRVGEEVQRYLDADVPVGEHLADQLLLLLALARGGAFRTLPPTTHTTTHAEVLRAFLPIRIEMTPEDDAFRIAVR